MAAVTPWQIVEALAAYDSAVQPGTVPTLPVRMAGMRAALEAAAAAVEPPLTQPVGPAPVRDTFYEWARDAKEPEVRLLNSPPPARCQAVREGDEMACGRCGLRWSPGDEDPPKCSPVERRVSIRREGG